MLICLVALGYEKTPEPMEGPRVKCHSGIPICANRSHSGRDHLPPASMWAVHAVDARNNRNTNRIKHGFSCDLGIFSWRKNDPPSVTCQSPSNLNYKFVTYSNNKIDAGSFARLFWPALGYNSPHLDKIKAKPFRCPRINPNQNRHATARQGSLNRRLVS